MYALGTIHNDACVVGNMIPSSQSWRENSDVNWAPHTGLETRAFVTRIYHAHVSQVPNLKLIH